jgi:integrase
MEMTWLQQRGGRFRAAREVAEQLRSSLDCAEVRNALDAIPPVGGSSHQVDAVVRPYAEPLGFSGQKKDLFKWTLGGRGARRRYGGSFRRKADANARAAWIRGELAQMRVPDLRLVEPERVSANTLTEVAERWRESRIDVTEGTAQTYIVNLNRILPVLGPTPVDELTTDDVQRLITELRGLDRESLRKTRSTLAQVLDFAEVIPNPARDKRVKLPYEEPEQIDPPTADHVEAVIALLPAKYVLPVLWLDWSAHRVTAGIDKVTVGDWDAARGRVRARAKTTKTRRAHWREVPPVLAGAIERTLPPRDDRDLSVPLFAGVDSDALRTAIRRACQATGTPLWSPHDLKHRRISLLHAQGYSWAQISELVGNTSAKVLADTYTHVLMDEREIDYAVAGAYCGRPVGR